jgi:beta-mannanase
VLRFAHEMNGSWYPWSAGTNGNTARDYVAAWRHLHSVFTAQGVGNVSWNWSPNVPSVGATPLSSLYPGDAHVDQVALDGYNWGTTRPGSTWTAFWDVFSSGVTELRGLTGKPLWIGEVASAEQGGDKAAWIEDMFSSLVQHPEVRGFTWFDFAKETDWRIGSTTASMTAFRAGLATCPR